MRKFIEEIKTKKIPYAQFGYNQISTDNLIDQIIKNFEIILEENEKLKDIEEKYNKAIEQIEVQESKIKYYKSIFNGKEIFDLDDKDK